MGFGTGVRESGNRMLTQVNKKIVDRSIELFTLIVKDTPVGTSKTKGQLINNWHLGSGKGQYNRSVTSSFNTSGMASYNEISKLRTSVQFLGGDGEVSLSNSVHYAFRAEYAGWPKPEWSGMVGPYAMVRNSLNTVASKYKR